MEPELGGGEAAPAIWMSTPFNATGTALLCAVIVSYLLARSAWVFALSFLLG